MEVIEIENIRIYVKLKLPLGWICAQYNFVHVSFEDEIHFQNRPIFMVLRDAIYPNNKREGIRYTHNHINALIRHQKWKMISLNITADHIYVLN